MGDKRGFLVRMPDETYAAVTERAAEMGISANEWFLRCTEHYLASKGAALTRTVTYVVTVGTDSTKEK